MTKVLFLIHDLGQGGAEKVLVNLVNNMDYSQFDVTVMSLFGGGVNEQFLNPAVHYRTVWQKMIPANSKWMKLMNPQQLHSLCIKEHYDIEVAYLEGPAARIISGCPDPNVKKLCWVHCNLSMMKEAAAPFRNTKETLECYQGFDRVICVSEVVKENFGKLMQVQNQCEVLYNTTESERIQQLAREAAPEIQSDCYFKICAVGSLKPVKGYDRLLRIIKELKECKYQIHLYLLGKGPQREEFEKYIADNQLEDSVTLLGYQTNPYRFISKCDLFVCSSLSEGFSTAATEALIVGVPVCTVDVSGMREMLGNNNEYGVITENNDQALYEGIKSFLDSPELWSYYKTEAQERGQYFSTERTVRAVEDMLISL